MPMRKVPTLNNFIRDKEAAATLRQPFCNYSIKIIDLED